jgi:hypothetical protein
MEAIVLFESIDQIQEQILSLHLSHKTETFDCNIGYFMTKCQNSLSNTTPPQVYVQRLE